MRTLLIAAALGATLTACASSGGVLTPLGRASATESPERYADLAAASAQFEVQSAQLAVARSGREDVRAFAGNLVERHDLVAGRLAAATTASGLAPPSGSLTAAQQRMLAALDSAPADRFDTVYLRQQLTEQRNAMRIHSVYALGGDAPLLRPVAESGSGTAFQHYQEVRRLIRAHG
jgi:putative membrane protein